MAALPAIPALPGAAMKDRIGTNIRILMTARGTDARHLASMLHWSESALSRRLSGKTDLAAHELAMIADALEVEPGVFFLAPEDLVRSRCFSLVPAVGGQLEFNLGEPPQLSVAV